MANSATDPATAAKLADYVAKLPTVRIVSKAAPNYSLAIRGGKVTLAPTSPSDATQSWVKVDRSSKFKKDDEGFPVFHLVNKGTGQAIKHPDAHHPVQLTPFKAPLSDSTLWSQTSSSDVYKEIRKANNATLVLDAFGEKVFEGVDVGLWGRKGATNQLWSIVPFSYATALLDSVANLPPVRVTSKARTNYSLAIRNGKVTLARTSASDPLQRWVVNFDKGSNKAFALINISTGQALKHVDNHLRVQLIPFDPVGRDESTLWSLTNECGGFFYFFGLNECGGYKVIRKANDTTRVLDVFGGDKDVYEGIGIGLWEWHGGDNQIWSIDPY